MVHSITQNRERNSSKVPCADLAKPGMYTFIFPYCDDIWGLNAIICSKERTILYGYFCEVGRIECKASGIFNTRRHDPSKCICLLADLHWSLTLEKASFFKWRQTMALVSNLILISLLLELCHRNLVVVTDAIKKSWICFLIFLTTSPMDYMWLAGER